MAIIVGQPGDDIQLKDPANRADTIFGDRQDTLSGIGRNDRIFALDLDDVLIDDAQDIAASGQGGDDVMFGGTGSDSLYGDARLTLRGIGGSDLLSAGVAGSARQLLYGDAFTMAAGSRGGSDRLEGGHEMTGDGANLTGAIGGHDLIDARDVTGGSNIRLYGDALGTMSGGSHGGDDRLLGSALGGRLTGDAVLLLDTSTGGDDDLTGNAGADVIFGDAAEAVRGFAVAGNDVVRGRAGSDELFGDAPDLTGASQGGDDSLYSGAGNDRLWGDGRLAGGAHGGNDVFHFAGHFGDDKILDFRDGEDQLVFNGFLQIDISIDRDDGNTIITTAPGDTVSILDFTGPLSFGTDILLLG